VTAPAYLRCRAAGGARCATGLEPDGLWAETSRRPSGGRRHSWSTGAAAVRPTLRTVFGDAHPPSALPPTTINPKWRAAELTLLRTPCAPQSDQRSGRVTGIETTRAGPHARVLASAATSPPTETRRTRVSRPAQRIGDERAVLRRLLLRSAEPTSSGQRNCRGFRSDPASDESNHPRSRGGSYFVTGGRLAARRQKRSCSSLCRETSCRSRPRPRCC
jgi:hypothetical protein